MPRIVPLPSRSTTPPTARKPRGRDYAAVMAASTAEPVRTVTHGGLRDQPHMSYNPHRDHRAEYARHLMPWARARTGAGPFDHTAY